jgi:ribosomal-protein-alanine N-acetyltransferase
MWLTDEVHLLNLSVDAPVQGLGLGGAMLDWLMDDAGSRGARSMLLEVRPSNTPALRLYERKGFHRVGLRRRYYPAHDGAREDAIVMVRRLLSDGPHG